MARKSKKFATGGTVTDPKTGKTYDRPSYGGASIKGLTSTDPANVARNREAAARYASMPSSGSGNGNGGRTLGGGSAAPATRTVQTRTYNAPPAGYDVGKNGEWNYYTYGTKQVADTSGASTRKPIPGLFGAFGNAIQKIAASKGVKIGTPTKSMKSGGAVKATGKQMRGCGCATRGTKGGKMV